MFPYDHKKQTVLKSLLFAHLSGGQREKKQQPDTKVNFKSLQKLEEAIFYWIKSKTGGKSPE